MLGVRSQNVLPFEFLALAFEFYCSLTYRNLYSDNTLMSECVTVGGSSPHYVPINEESHSFLKMKVTYTRGNQKNDLCCELKSSLQKCFDPTFCVRQPVSVEQYYYC